MESGAFAGAPAVAEEPTTQPEQPVAQPEPTQPATPEQPAQEGGEPNEVLAAIKGLEQRIDTLGPQPTPEAPAPDLLDSLLGEGEPAPEVAPEAPAQQGVPGDPEQAQALAELQQFVRAEAEQIVTPYIEQQREREIRALQQEYPDITKPEILEPLERTVQDFIEATGDEGLKTNPDFIRRAYKLVRAEQADASAVPAEQAATSGASLETNGGQSQAGAGELSAEDQYKQLVYGKNTRAEF